MKKLAAAIAALVVAGSLSACGGTETSAPPAPVNESTQQNQDTQKDKDEDTQKDDNLSPAQEKKFFVMYAAWEDMGPKTKRDLCFDPALAAQQVYQQTSGANGIVGRITLKELTAFFITVC